jgi:cytochrome b6-f complex iron-sulfur subunit
LAGNDRASESRRNFLIWLARSFVSLWGLGFLWITLGFLKPPKSRRSVAETVLRLGPVDSLPVGGALLVRHRREPIYVVRTDEATLVGLSAACTHIHCILTWDEREQRLLCPCHNGAFDVNGNVVGGPPPRPLKRYQVDTRLGQIYVHL